MCIVTWTTSHPDYALILATNRDEFLHRETEEACWRSKDTLQPAEGREQEQILCGRDAAAGGTWFALGQDGRLGVLTNFTEPPPSTPPTSSRGALLVSYLSSSSTSPVSFLESIAPSAPSFAAFNLLLFDLFPQPSLVSKSTVSNIAYLSNRGSERPVSLASNATREGCASAMSNSLFSDPWAKVEQARTSLDDLAAQKSTFGEKWDDEKWEAELRSLMRRSVPLVSRDDFKRSVSIEPIQIPYPLSTPPTPRWYATRLVTTLLVTRDGHYRFSEKAVWTLDSDGSPCVSTAPARVFEGSLDRSND